jgi:predicted phosphodiesterase
MERTKTNKKPSLILTSDWHLRRDTPICYTGDFQQEQWDTLDFLKDLQIKCDCTIVMAGDLFEKWYNVNDFLTTVMQHLPNELYVIYGQHDLQNHNLDMAYKSSIDTLIEAERIKLLPECHFGQLPEKGSLYFPNRDPDRTVLVWHHMTYINPPFPGATGGNAIAILKKYPQYDLIVTGDNHQSFYTEHEGRLLVNPGNLTRQVADQAEFQPRVALWYAETNTIEWINIPIQEGVISREHIAHKEQRDERIDAFISKLDTDFKAELSFEDNLEMFFQQNEIRDSVRKIIYKSLD